MFYKNSGITKETPSLALTPSTAQKSTKNSVPPTGTLLLTNVSPSASSAALGFDTNERLTLPDSTGATVTNVFGPELELFSGKMLYIEGIDPVIRTFEQTDVLQLTFEF